ncbi:VC0807 family protein [Paraburkholderia pallida]|uniref:Transmembrane protein n=1 Tax=Paraburkholderia pallida TaxID=2547399 RepID=A0A4P7CYP2_9BURK|nr:VC0807 family protein [Paraburkholderia pallida]QBQ99479.1 hypothetical protein E1956_20085 [Paraburkholderia pallida]
MKHPFRYLSALCINVLLPWLAYRLALPHWGYLQALAASALPPLAWMAYDYIRLRHFDALSALVLVSITLSLALTLLGRAPLEHAAEAPMISGSIGIVFLLSLLLPRPLVFYLARSKVTRKNRDGAAEFEQHWREHPGLVAVIRRMTVVWGVGLVAENVLRCWIVWTWAGKPEPATVSAVVGYAVYGALTLWTFWYRRRFMKRVGKAAEALAKSEGS